MFTAGTIWILTHGQVVTAIPYLFLQAGEIDFFEGDGGREREKERHARERNGPCASQIPSHPIPLGFSFSVCLLAVSM